MKTRYFLPTVVSALLAGNVMAQDAKTANAAAAGIFQHGDNVITSLPAPVAPQGGATCFDLDAYGPNGTPSWDGLDDPSNVTVVFNIGAGNQLTGLAWDATIEALGASWLSEAAIWMSDSTGSAYPNSIILRMGAGVNMPGTQTFSSGGVIPFASVPLPNIVAGADGEIHFQFFETFNDVSDAIDANHTNSAAPVTCAGLYLACTDQAACDAAVGGGDPAADHARFAVSKDFNDNNTASVDVTLTCNTGLPLMQPATIEEGDPVNFVVGDFEQGTLDCEVVEDVPAGYTASYNDGDGVSAVNCSWEDLIGAQYTCRITNTLQQVEVEVTKVWIDENPQFNAQNVAGADWSCSNVAFGTNSGFLDFEGNPDTRSFYVYPRWQGNTSCSITEVDLLESGIEVDDDDCQGLGVSPGSGNSCTIFNTRLYEGIPTLSQYGLALMALLMLGVGFVAFRRYS